MIEVQKTADENIINFFAQKKFIENGEMEFITAKSLRKSPLAEAIFDLGGVESVLISADMISVRKKSDADWEPLRSLVLAEIMNFMSTGEPAVIKEKEESEAAVFERICALTAARIRPAIQRDGGNITIDKFVDGIVFVTLSGNCAGCPYAMVTLKEGVEKILKTYIPQVKEVRPSEGSK